MGKSKSRRTKPSAQALRRTSVPPVVDLAALGLVAGGPMAPRVVDEQDLADAMRGRVAFSGSVFLPGVSLNTVAHLYLDWILGRGDFASLEKVRVDQGAPASWRKLGGRVHLREDNLDDGDFFSLSVRPLHNKLAFRFTHVIHRDDLGPCDSLLRLPVPGKTREEVQSYLGEDGLEASAPASLSLNKPGALTALVTHHIGLVYLVDPHQGNGVVLEHAVRYSPPPGLIAAGLGRLVYVPAPWAKAVARHGGGSERATTPVLAETEEAFAAFMGGVASRQGSALVVLPGGPLTTVALAQDFLSSVMKGVEGYCSACVALPGVTGPLALPPGLHFLPGLSGFRPDAPSLAWEPGALVRCAAASIISSPTALGNNVWLEVMGGISDVLDTHGLCVDRVEFLDQDRQAQEIEAGWSKTKGGRAAQEKLAEQAAELHQAKKDLRIARSKAEEQEKIRHRAERAHAAAQETYKTRIGVAEASARDLSARRAALEVEVAQFRARAEQAETHLEHLEDLGHAMEEHQRLVQAEVALKAEVASLHDMLHISEVEQQEARALAEELRGRVHTLETRLESMGSRIISARGSGSDEDPERAARMVAVLSGEPSLEQSLLFLAEAFPDRLVVLASALASAQESDEAGFVYRRRAFELLKDLVTTYRDALTDGDGDVEARKIFGRDGYASKESETGDGNERMRRARTYTYKGREIYMGRHLKLNYKVSIEETLRIHFHWDAEDQKIVLGHVGEHRWKLVS